MSAVAKKSPLKSTIGTKFIVAITGLFLISFLIVHLSGNLLLLRNDGGAAFDAYAHFMGHNPIINLLEIVLFGGFLLHIGMTLSFSARNNSARPIKYKVYKPDETTSFGSRWMLASGLVVLTFLIIHLIDFFFPFKFSGPNDPPHHMLAPMRFSEAWRVALYVVAMGLLFMHLSHGFRSAFQTFGIQLNSKMGQLLGGIGYFLAFVLSAGFVLIAVWFFVQTRG